MGEFVRFEVNNTKECWDKYTISNGANSYDDFLMQLGFPNDERGYNRAIGNVIFKLEQPINI
jgi:hypothetical protein